MAAGLAAAGVAGVAGYGLYKTIQSPEFTEFIQNYPPVQPQTSEEYMRMIESEQVPDSGYPSHLAYPVAAMTGPLRARRNAALVSWA